jgi:hypothetical protein
MIAARDEMVERLGFERAAINAFYDLWSQHIHILPLSFYCMEPGGRGSGFENEIDRAYIGRSLIMCAGILKRATDGNEREFPDAVAVRRGARSTFRPGLRVNRP